MLCVNGFNTWFSCVIIVLVFTNSSKINKLSLSCLKILIGE
jgi:hypothetical protein